MNDYQNFQRVLDMAQHDLDDLPSGWCFLPKDAQLIKSYLFNKVNGLDVPANVIQDIDATEFYSVHPSRLVKKTRDGRGSYFFVHEDDYFSGNIPEFKVVGDGVGFWKPYGDEKPIYDENENILAYKIRAEYNSGGINKSGGIKKTNWRMQLWRLNRKCKGDEKKEEMCVLGKFGLKEEFSGELNR